MSKLSFVISILTLAIATPAWALLDIDLGGNSDASSSVSTNKTYVRSNTSTSASVNTGLVQANLGLSANANVNNQYQSNNNMWQQQNSNYNRQNFQSSSQSRYHDNAWQHRNNDYNRYRQSVQASSRSRIVTGRVLSVDSRNGIYTMADSNGRPRNIQADAHFLNKIRVGDNVRVSVREEASASSQVRNY